MEHPLRHTSVTLPIIFRQAHAGGKLHDYAAGIVSPHITSPLIVGEQVFSGVQLIFGR